MVKDGLTYHPLKKAYVDFTDWLFANADGIKYATIKEGEVLYRL